MSKYKHTINWDDHWETKAPSELEEMEQGGKAMAGRLEQFFDGFPDSFLSVGCGFAFTLFTLAKRYPKTTFVGVDISHSVIVQNRERASNQGLENLTFKEGGLPDLNLSQAFDCVYCYATLHYVADTESAVQTLYTHVQSGGSLIFHYPNRYTRASVRNADSEHVRERFELVIKGENLLTYNEIRELIGRQPRSFWRAVGEEEWRDLGRNLPCVYVNRPA